MQAKWRKNGLEVYDAGSCHKYEIYWSLHIVQNHNVTCNTKASTLQLALPYLRWEYAFKLQILQLIKSKNFQKNVIVANWEIHGHEIQRNLMVILHMQVQAFFQNLMLNWKI